MHYKRNDPWMEALLAQDTSDQQQTRDVEVPEQLNGAGEPLDQEQLDALNQLRQAQAEQYTGGKQVILNGPTGFMVGLTKKGRLCLRMGPIEARLSIDDGCDFVNVILGVITEACRRGLVTPTNNPATYEAFRDVIDSPDDHPGTFQNRRPLDED